MICNEIIQEQSGPDGMLMRIEMTWQQQQQRRRQPRKVRGGCNTAIAITRGV